MISCVIIALAPVSASAEDFTGAADRISPSAATLTITLSDGSVSNGSGFAAGDGRVLVTNHHVIEDAVTVRATFGDGSSATALGLLALDPAADLAALALPESRPPAALAPTPRPGSPVLAVGNPHGLGMTYTDGIVSGIRQLDGYTVVQHSAPISPGNSGGPLVDTQGRVVGVNSFFWALEHSQNLNFAVGAEHLEPVLLSAASALEQGALRGYPVQAAAPAYLALEDLLLPPPSPGARALFGDIHGDPDGEIEAFVAAHRALRDREFLLAFVAALTPRLSAAPPGDTAGLQALLDASYAEAAAPRLSLYGLDGLLVGMTVEGVEAVTGHGLAPLPPEDCFADGDGAVCYRHQRPTAIETERGLATVYHAVDGRLLGVIIALAGRGFDEVVSGYAAELLSEPALAAAPGAGGAIRSAAWSDFGLTVIAGEDADVVLVNHAGYPRGPVGIE